MRSRRLPVVSLVVIVGLLLTGLGPALAAPSAPSYALASEIEFTGTVVSVDSVAGSFQVEVEAEGGGTETYTVWPPEGFDLTSLEVGDTVEVEGFLEEDGTVSATEVNVEQEEIEFTGTVVSVDLVAGTFDVQVETEEGTVTYTVLAPEGFDLASLAEGDVVEVEGFLEEDGTVTATEVVVEEEEPEEIEFTGTVLSIDTAVGGFEVEVELEEGGTVVYIVWAPEGFDLESLEEGDVVEVEGYLEEDGTVTATKVVVEEEEPLEIEFTGTVVSIDLEAGTFDVEVELEGGGTVVYTVWPPEGFDLEDLEVGDVVEVEGYLDDEGTVTAYKVVIEEEEPEEIEFTGTVVSIDPEAGTFDVEVETDEGTVTYTVLAPEGFDLADLEVGDVVEVEGYLEDDGTVTATKVVIVEDEEEEEEEDEDTATNGGFFCTHLDVYHPVGKAIADRFDVPYEEVMEWFCSGHGFGQIVLALQTAKLTEGSADELLARRKAGEGWGVIWKDAAISKAETKGKVKAAGNSAAARKPKKPKKPKKPHPVWGSDD